MSSVRPIRWLGQAWQDTTRVVRVAFFVMWIIGAALLTVGLIGDCHGFWVNKPFATNVITAFTGALFGIPIALLVLQQITSQQEAQAEARAARRLAARVSGNLYASALKWIVGEPACLTEIKAALLDIQEMTRRLNAIDWTTDEIGKALRHASRLWHENLAPAEQYTQVCAEVVMDCRYLDGDVRSRLLETDGPWIDALTRQNLQKACGELMPNLGGWWKQVFRESEPPDVSPTSYLPVGQLQEFLHQGIMEIEPLIQVIQLSGKVAETLRFGRPIPSASKSAQCS
jgi:hypothetical protein